ncbi:hypothetical protein OG558_24585 [Kribbella sp. NBC_01510]|uniref:hypothetical protein n=1 Tax=Kribbella sp. NBC_01510 TaxID=2903581 RepID=UPI00386CAE49
MSTGRHRPAADGPWLERIVLSTPVGNWSTLRLVVSLLWIAVMAGLSISFAYDDLMLDQRGELVRAQVIRTNYDQRGPSFNAELQSPFAGVRVQVEDIHQRPESGDVIQLEVDPRKPTRVRDPQSWRWNPVNVTFVALAPTGIPIAWAWISRSLRSFRRK